MTPLEFITDAAVNDANTPANKILEALSKPLVVQGAHGRYTILSYYYSPAINCMVIDLD